MSSGVLNADGEIPTEAVGLTARLHGIGEPF
jgi:hypothetical protein